MTDHAQPALIGIDWGSSFLRAYLFATDGTVLERQHRPWGIQRLPPGGYSAAFLHVAADWRNRWPHLGVLAAGMVGSRQGWHEVPYVDCPADAAAIAAGIVPFTTDCGTIHLVPGVRQGGDAPDVMRGEEVQIIGAMDQFHRHLGAASGDDAVLVLPGTHCKWARVRRRQIVGFTTYLTGELFAMLRDHSIIGRPARDSEPAEPVAAAAAFRRGVRAARESGSAGMAGQLFTTRSRFLAGEFSAAESLDYLSGLLIGEELRSARATQGGGPFPPCFLIGEPALCDRYRAAFSECGVEQAILLDDAGMAGLWSVANAAGLLDHGRPEVVLEARACTP